MDSGSRTGSAAAAVIGTQRSDGMLYSSRSRPTAAPYRRALPLLHHAGFRVILRQSTSDRQRLSAAGAPPWHVKLPSLHLQTLGSFSHLGRRRENRAWRSQWPQPPAPSKMLEAWLDGSPEMGLRVCS
ncbi:hypothetical protein ACSS6W_005171 [Trichoderma asperelloides]